ncbi:helix-turn-helix transcriptional regulator [Kutzneria albida]|uniref:helix-turn-helix transcriptional regulator n=1 Tax=Kutzneria albida TaxID=43357 RepID=UPI0011DE0D07|nr:helix-turn-helix domain-containing protein [Kutzneria albida]
MTGSGEGLWRPEELSAFLQIPETTLRQWRHKGYGPSWHKMGKHVRYDPAHVRAWLESQSSTPDAA